MLAERNQSKRAYWLCSCWSRIHSLGEFWRNLPLWVPMIHWLGESFGH